jgi:uncharacterized protein (TIGR02284 family)
VNEKDLIDRLSSLMQLDIDAVHAYGQAIDSIKDPAIKNELIMFRDDHERHIGDLSLAISNLGGQPPERSRDFKGFLIEGFTALRSVTGTEGALKAMKGNEELTNKTYRDALDLQLPPDIRDIVERNYRDEQRHLAYINRVLSNRSWEAWEKGTLHTDATER